MTLPSDITARRDNDRRGSKLGDLIRLLSSNNDGEVIAAVRAMQRTLESCGADIHALADHVERANGSLSEADKQKINAAIEAARLEGYAEGVTATESRQHGTGAFRNTDGSFDWSEVALFVQRQKHQLDAKHHQFVDDMASRTVYGREPTPNQHKYLHSLFYKLGGKIT
jgi:hypothetical protein